MKYERIEQKIMKYESGTCQDSSFDDGYDEINGVWFGELLKYNPNNN